MAIVTFTPPDHEFAAANGSNVNFSGSWSYFDHPPNSTKDLIISSNEGDPDPYTFETGETYDISWKGHGGGEMEDATVIRSDDWGNGQGVVIFEGINSNTGELFQMVWSPNFELEEWYWANGGGPSSPNAFWTGDQMKESYAASACFGHGTWIECPDGPHRIETLRAGDRVQTVDRGAIPIKWMSFTTQCLGTARPDQRPVRIQAHALGHDLPAADLTVSAQHRILVGSHGQLTHLFPEAVFVPAKALTSLPGISHLAAGPDIQWVHLALDQHDIIRANGAFSESMLLGKVALSAMPLLKRMHVWSLFHVPQDEDTPLNGPCARPTLRVVETARHLRAMSRQPLDAPLQWHIDIRPERRRTAPSTRQGLSHRALA